jgi:hypothetical protein
LAISAFDIRLVSAAGATGFDAWINPPFTILGMAYLLLVINRASTD